MGETGGRSGRGSSASCESLSFADCYRDSYAEMVRLATLLTGSVEDARDVVQDAFVKLHGAWTRVDRPNAYLQRTVVNGCHSWHRRRHLDRTRVAPVTLVTDTPAGDELTAALASLPDRQRAALVLRFYLDLTERDIATVLGCRVGTVGSLIHRGLAELRRTVER
jgi:RNA polymerase sigma-70 factor (sigma-E family)